MIVNVCNLIVFPALFLFPVPPSIVETVRSLTVNEGEEAKLMCENTGSPKPHISWIQDGRIMIESGGRYTIEDSGTLVIHSTEVRFRVDLYEALDPA